MNFMPSISKAKNAAFAVIGLAVAAYALTRLAPGVASFVGLRPGGAALPTKTVLTPPNVNELMGRQSARTNFVELNPRLRRSPCSTCRGVTTSWTRSWPRDCPR